MHIEDLAGRMKADVAELRRLNGGAHQETGRTSQRITKICDLLEMVADGWEATAATARLGVKRTERAGGVLQSEVGAWGQATFPTSTPATVARHLLREAAELYAATLRYFPEAEKIAAAEAVPEEVLAIILQRSEMGATGGDPAEWDWAGIYEQTADVQLLLYHLATKGGYSLQEAAYAKHTLNGLRRWGSPDAAGVVEHVRE